MYVLPIKIIIKNIHRIKKAHWAFINYKYLPSTGILQDLELLISELLQHYMK